MTTCHTEEHRRFQNNNVILLLQISYSLVVILKLNSIPKVQYKDVMMIDDEKYQQE